jgi:hypothetical protein
MQRRPTRRSIITWLELAVVVVAFALIGLLIVAAPHTSGGGTRVQPGVLSWLVYGGGVARVLFGSVWMVRLARSIREEDASTWRSRRR